MSPELTAFLKAWLDWTEAGAPDGKPFDRAYGLCANVVALPASAIADHEAVADDLNNELFAYFEDSSYPFGGASLYFRLQAECRQHENPKRLAWVREKLKAAGESA